MLSRSRAGFLFAACLVVVAGCGETYPTCSNNYCMPPFDVATWCGSPNSGCVAGGAPPDCGTGFCVVRRGQILSIPSAAFQGNMEGNDLEVDASAACAVASAPDVVATLDGVQGTRTRYSPTSCGNYVFRWSTLPQNAKTLTIVYNNADAAIGVNAFITFIDYTCYSNFGAPTSCAI
jgi:hypothetical protein